MTNSMTKENKRMLLWFLLGVLIALLPWIAMAQVKAPEKVKFSLNANAEEAIGYAQAVKVGTTLYISGTVGGSEDMSLSVKRVYDNLEKTLAHYGATFQNVVKENLYTTDLEAVKRNESLRKEYYKGDFPAATWVQIDRLYTP